MDTTDLDPIVGLGALPSVHDTFRFTVGSSLNPGTTKTL